MKTISTALQAHLTGETTTLATCWKLTRRDSTVLGFTDHDNDIVVDSVTYHAASGFAPASLTGDDSLGDNQVAVEGVLDSETIAEEDILAGLYDFAEINIFMVNYVDTVQGTLHLRTGWLGEVRMGNGRFEAELSGLAQQLQHGIGQLYSPSCRAQLGDAQCGVNMAGFTVNGTLTAVTDNRIMADSSRAETAGYFNSGKITFTSGNNDGLSMEVKQSQVGGILTLMLPMPYDAQVGDDYTLEAGCDKHFQTCINRFANALNFRGEPHIPGTDKMLETSSTRSG